MVAWIDGEGSCNQFFRLARELALLSHRGCVGPVRVKLGIVGRSLRGFGEGCSSIGISPQRTIRSRKEQPSLRILGMRLHAQRELLDHRTHILIGESRARGL